MVYRKCLPYWFTVRERRQSPFFFLQPTYLRRLAGYRRSSGGGITAERPWVFRRDSQQGSKARNVCCNGCSNGWEVEPVRFFLLAQKFSHHKQWIYSERWTNAAWTGKLLGTKRVFQISNISYTITLRDHLFTVFCRTQIYCLAVIRALKYNSLNWRELLKWCFICFQLNWGKNKILSL